MPSDVFQRADMRYLATALAENSTHDGITVFEMSLGIDTSGKSKPGRAAEIIRHIWSRPNTDRLVLDLLNYLYVENVYADQLTFSDPYTQLRDQVLEPRGVELAAGGYTLPDGEDVDSLGRAERSQAPALPQAPIPGFVASPSPSQTQPPATARETIVPAITRDPSKVFVVHGRDTRPVDVLKQYLAHLGLHMMPWYEAVGLTGESQPHTYDIVKAGMDGAAAIIVIFSPDDLARVKDEFSPDGDPDRVLQGQARQNVILEAGMAFALERSRTIFLRSAHTRDISDISGFNWVTLDGEWESRQDLKGRLTQAGAAVRPGDYNLADTTAGTFRV